MKSRRVLFVLVLAVAFVASLLAGKGATRATAGAPAVVRATAIDAKRAEPAWFCPGLPPSLPAGDDRVMFANVGADDASLTITVLADQGKPATQQLRLPASSTLIRPRASLGAPGALTVEVFGGRVIVEEGIDGSNGLDITPCASQSSTQWQFAAGTTVRGAQQWLVLENPFATDAEVNVVLRTSTGLHRPEPLQDLVVPGRTRVIQPIHTSAVFLDRVAVEVDATRGRVVASQTLVFTADAGAPGVASTIGAPAAADRWSFATGATLTGETSWLALTNTGTSDAQVDVQAVPATNVAPASTSVTVAVDDVVWVRLGGCDATSANCAALPDDTRYALDVRAPHGASIVAQVLSRYATRASQLGASTSLGATLPAATWYFATDQARGARATSLALFNPTALPATVNVGLVHDGTVDRPAALQSIAVAPGQKVELELVGGRKPPTLNAAVVVDATSPVIVERSVNTSVDLSTSVGVALT